MKINKTKIRSLVCVLMLMLGLWTQPTQADQSYGYHYHYTSLSEVPLPPGFVEFQPGAIDDRGRVYGTVSDANNSFATYAAVYENGAIRVLHPGVIFTPSANARGTVGGAVIDSQTGTYQAALFRGDQVEIIPSLPGVTYSFVQSLNDSNTALVWSQDPSGLNRNTYRLYNKGKTIFSFQLPTGSDCWLCWGVNNQGIVSGTLVSLPDFNDASRAIRFIPPYGDPELLDPLPEDINSNSYGINSSGNILGLSSSFVDPTKNHYGIWDQKGDFKLYFEGIFYNYAIFNDNNLIVLSGNYDDLSNVDSFLVPKPGVLLNLKNLLDNPSALVDDLAQAIDINNRGDIIGFGVCTSSCPSFLLRRVGPPPHRP